MVRIDSAINRRLKFMLRVIRKVLMKFKLILFVMIAFAAGMQAQEVKSQKTWGEPQAVTNDDRGRAFIITGEMLSLSLRGQHERVIIEPRQQSVFLGSGWAAES